MVLLDQAPIIMTPKDVSKVLNMPLNQVYRLFKSKKFPSERVRGKYIIPKQRFITWLEMPHGKL